MTTVAHTILANGPHEYGFAPGPWFLLVPLFWAAVIVTVIVLVKRRGAQWRRHHGAEGVLRERFARGEVTEEEYRQRLEVLRAK
ncbi:putative membrane protein [Stackebrandtia albiflava]|uniref:Putative membrane protein n=1 Tax=Stackebrandtia albiflava TaxID=406432 RepID=A0A562VH34_9ACTN|nr:SHOCT domain-containing protein [Stackebrandtia albiflava]TWJ17107.1 putative membrane protein [Stackebrandtia albiflava]